MIARRDLLIGGACVAAASSAYALEPRQRQVLLTDGKIGDALPAVVGDWTAENSDALVQPRADSSLAAKLYSELIGRIYHNGATGEAVMMLVAYGETQNDLLQMHRPEACYPAVGFSLVSTDPAKLALPGGGHVPVRHVVAKAQQRQENILYWARMGEMLPDSAAQQRKARLRIAMQGYVPDGALVRFSMLGQDASQSFAVMNVFIPQLLSAVGVDKRRVLIGTDLAKSMRT